MFEFTPQDLIDDLKSELSGNFEDAVLAMMMEPRKYDAHQMRKAVKVQQEQWLPNPCVLILYRWLNARL